MFLELLLHEVPVDALVIGDEAVRLRRRDHVFQLAPAVEARGRAGVGGLLLPNLVELEEVLVTSDLLDGVAN